MARAPLVPVLTGRPARATTIPKGRRSSRRRRLQHTIGLALPRLPFGLAQAKKEFTGTAAGWAVRRKVPEHGEGELVYGAGLLAGTGAVPPPSATPPACSPAAEVSPAAFRFKRRTPWATISPVPGPFLLRPWVTRRRAEYGAVTVGGPHVATFGTLRPGGGPGSRCVRLAPPRCRWRSWDG